MSAYVAERRRGELRVRSTGEAPRMVAKLKISGHDNVDTLLRTAGWRRIGAWATNADTGHRAAAVTPTTTPTDRRVTRWEHDIVRLSHEIGELS